MLGNTSNSLAGRAWIRLWQFPRVELTQHAGRTVPVLEDPGADAGSCPFGAALQSTNSPCLVEAWSMSVLERSIRDPSIQQPLQVASIPISHHVRMAPYCYEVRTSESAAAPWSNSAGKHQFERVIATYSISRRRAQKDGVRPGDP